MVRASGPDQTPPGEAQEVAPSQLRASAWWWIRNAAIAVALFAGYQLLLIVGSWVLSILHVLLYLVFGLILAYLLTPLIGVLENRLGIPRTGAILAALLAVLGLLVLGVYLISGPLIQEAKSLGDELPSLTRRAQDQWRELAPQLLARGIAVDPNAVAATLGGVLGSHLESLLVRGLTTTVQTIADTVIVLVVSFWLLKDGANIRRVVVASLPAPVRGHLNFAFDAVDRVIGGYVRAQLLMALLIGTLAGLGSLLIGVPFPLLVALAAGIFELIPIVGPFAGGAVGISLALTRNPTLALETLGLFLVIHVIEGYLLAPRIQAHFTRIHPLVAFLAIFAGVEVGGFLGALFAVPVASLGAVLLRATIGDWRAQRPELFQAPETDPSTRIRRKRILDEFRFSPAKLFRRKSRLAE